MARDFIGRPKSVDFDDPERESIDQILRFDPADREHDIDGTLAHVSGVRIHYGLQPRSREPCREWIDRGRDWQSLLEPEREATPQSNRFVGCNRSPEAGVGKGSHVNTRDDELKQWVSSRNREVLEHDRFNEAELSSHETGRGRTDSNVEWRRLIHQCDRYACCEQDTRVTEEGRIGDLDTVDGQCRDRERWDHEPEHISTSDREHDADQILRNDTGQRVHDCCDLGNESSGDVAFGIPEGEQEAAR